MFSLFERFHERLRVRLTFRRLKQKDKTSILGERFCNLLLLLIPALSILINHKLLTKFVIKITKRSATNFSYEVIQRKIAPFQ